VIGHTHVNAGAMFRCPTEIVSFPLGEANVKPKGTKGKGKGSTHVRILLDFISLS
jgi:hypothetical protein